MSYLIKTSSGRIYEGATFAELVESFTLFTGTTFTLEGYKPAELHGYTKEWTLDEIRRDRANTVLRRLPVGWTLYQSIDVK